MKQGLNKTSPSLSAHEFEVIRDTTLQTDCLLQDSFMFDKGCHAALLNRFIQHCVPLNSEFISLLGVMAMFILLIVEMVPQVCYLCQNLSNEKVFIAITYALLTMPAKAISIT